MSESRYEEALRRIHSVLKAIDGESSLSDLATKLGWRRATLYTVLRALEKLGLVQLELVSGVPRKVVPKITEKGKTLLECLDKVLS